jgi:NADH dehydrogenase
LPLPIGLMRIAALLFDRLPFFPVTRDQLAMLAQGNAAKPDALRRLIGREPRRFSAETLAYLRG